LPGHPQRVLRDRLAEIIGAERLIKLQVEAAVAGSKAAERRFTKRLARNLARALAEIRS
jgi:hypothetical protein